MIVANKITKMRVFSMIHQDQVWGKKNYFLTSIEKKGMNNKDKDAKSEGWNQVIFSLNSPVIHPITQAKLYKPKRPN